jgi:crotonobetainyl-CoA:carnitine CoA-transferase CaiB-like acyl-CoA transferase
MATIGVLAALNARHLTGRGQHVDISMLDAQISLLNYMATMHFLSGIIPDKLGNGHFVHVPYDSFTCSDGYIIIAIIADNFWEALLTVIPAADLNTEEHKYQPGRLKNKELISPSQRNFQQARKNTGSTFCNPSASPVRPFTICNKPSTMNKSSHAT